MPRPGFRKPLTYRDALKLLGADDSAALAIADRIAGAGVAAVNVATVGAVGFFELREQAVSWGNSIVRSLRERITGMSRLDRTERIVAAHAVLVITSFYEALQEVEGIDLKKAEITPAEQAMLATDAPVGSPYRQLLEALASTPLPMPTPAVPFELVIMELASYYTALAARLQGFISGLAVFEHLQYDTLINAFGNVCADAVNRYAIAFRQLAAEVPEFAVWASMADNQATRHALGMLGDEVQDRLDTLNTGLAGVREMLAATSGGSTPDQLRKELALFYGGYLDKSALDSREAPEGVVIPEVRAAYVNPACRVAAEPYGAQALLAVDSWWDDAPLVTDVQAFLVGHLTCPQATQAPLVILGQPGSGKSVLTRLLAASLPPADFLPVRVELRTVPADADIQDQIREAVYLAIDRHVDWPDLLIGSDGALPVVLLDGFDELLQATGVNQADYLERVRNFQQRQAELDRPVAIIVTSRTAVADRARFPIGSIAIRLEPFDEARVRQWLAGWAAANTEVLAARGLRPLPAEVALAQIELAGEPLLLLLLALYDAGANALQRVDGALGRADLYERLMSDFARREVRKHQPSLAPDEEMRSIERELRQLSVAALAMFNRGQQIITETELNEDLAALLGNSSPGGASAGAGLNRSLTAAQTIVGRFFFVHEPTVRRDTGAEERSFEFLHATFGEFLVARLVVQTVLELVADRAYLAERPNPPSLDAGFLHVATSFELLSNRAPIIEFCAGLFGSRDSAQRASCRALIVELLETALYPHPLWSYGAYQPVDKAITARCAAFSANLVLLAVYAEDSPVEVSELLPARVLASPIGSWYSFASLWRSQITESGSLLSVLRARVIAGGTSTTEIVGRGELAEMWISPEDGSPVLFSECVMQYHRHEQAEGAARAIRKSSSVDGYSIAAEGYPGRMLREATFFDEHFDPDGYLPFWSHVTESEVYTSETDIYGSSRRLLYELALAPADALPSHVRSRIYGFLFGDSSAQEAALRMLCGDMRHFTVDDAGEVIESLAHEIRLPQMEIFAEVLAEAALRFGPLSRPEAYFVLSARDRYVKSQPDGEDHIRAAFARVRVPYPFDGAAD